MQPLKILTNWLQNNTNKNHYLFILQDLQTLFPHLSNNAFKTLLSRAAKIGILEKVCRGLYAYKPQIYANGLLLFHSANHLRSNQLNYISLETVLSDVGIISQIPINVISIMSSGRSNKISCGKFGLIEFIHTAQKPTKLIDYLIYDQSCRLWRANIDLALKDMQKTKRNMDLIDWEIANELVLNKKR